MGADVATLLPDEVDLEVIENPRAVGEVPARPELRERSAAEIDLVAADEHVVVTHVGVVDDGAAG